MCEGEGEPCGEGDGGDLGGEEDPWSGPAWLEKADDHLNDQSNGKEDGEDGESLFPSRCWWSTRGGPSKP